MASGQLASFALKNVCGLGTGEKKGSGAYGAVYKVTVDGVPCIAKRLHDILVDPEVPKRQRASIQQKFHDECVLLCQLRHPNVVHFVGVHYGSNQDDMSLIMECLDTDLARCLESQPNIPVGVKLSILLDVSYGLLYLHTHSPQIIHRDLTAANILLTRDKRAKLADLGVSKLLDPRTQAAMMQTKAPGTPYYMPPESLMQNPKYDEKLDIFSFGHLALYVINQVFPEVFEVIITSVVLRDHEETLQILKRQKAIDEMGRDHCLHEVVTKCLQDNPQKRPTTLKLNEMLNHLCMKHPRKQQDVTEFESENKRLRDDIKVHQDEMKNMEQLFQAQQQEHKAQLEQANRLQRTQLEDVHRHLRKANQQLDQTVTDNEELQEDVLAKTQQVKQYKKQVDGLKAEVIKYKSQRPTTKEELDIQTAIFESKQTEAARQLEEVTRKLRDAMKMVEEARRERDALQAEVAQLKSRKMNERHYSAAFQKEFEKRGEFQAKYHHALDRCTELFEQVLQLRGILEYHKIKIPDPPPKQRAPPADIPRATTQQPQTLISRSSEGALHTPVYHGDPAAQHTSPPLARADPPSANVPPEVHPYPLQPYKFHKLPAPIQPIPQQGGGDVYEPHTQAWVQSQPYNPSEQPSDMIYQDMRHENEANTKDLAVKVQMKLEDENIKALFAQQNAARHQEQDRQFHQQHEMAHPQQGHFHPHMHGPQHPDAVNVQPKEEESLQGVPMDPNLVCPMCGHGYRVGEIQRYRRHVKSCHGSNQ